MKNQIIVDSCCDLTQEMKNEMGIITIPLTMTLSDTEFRDDESLDINDFLDKLSRSTGAAKSASPSPYLYQEAIEASEDAFIVSLSGKLSGSYNNAVLGNREAVDNGYTSAHVFDSKTAVAGETLIAIKLHELIQSGMNRERIIETVHRFIDEMKTYLVLENYTNLRKNGRLNRFTGAIIQALNIKLLMGADGNGEIVLFEKCKGIKHAMRQMANMVKKSGKDTHNENLVISHCDNQSLAEQLRDLVREQFHFKKIFIVPTRGVSSLYIDHKGIVMAF